MRPPLRFVQGPTGPEWVTDGIAKVGIGTQEQRTDIVNLGLAENETRPVTQAFIDSLVDVHKAGGGGLTKQELGDVLNHTGLKVF